MILIYENFCKMSLCLCKFFFPLPLWNSHRKRARDALTMVESTQVSPASFQVCKLYVFVHEVSHFPQAYVAFLAVGNLEQEIPHIYKYFF